MKQTEKFTSILKDLILQIPDLLDSLRYLYSIELQEQISDEDIITTDKKIDDITHLFTEYWKRKIENPPKERVIDLDYDEHSIEHVLRDTLEKVTGNTKETNRIEIFKIIFPVVSSLIDGSITIDQKVTRSVFYTDLALSKLKEIQS